MPLYRGSRRLILVRKPLPPVVGGASVAPLFGNSVASSASPFTTSGIAFSAGVAVVAIVMDAVGTLPQITGVTINGAAATQIGTFVGDAGQCSMWYATVAAGTGSVAIANASTFQCIGVCGWMLTGLVGATPTANTFQNNFTVNHADPQGPLGSFTVNSGGIGLIAIGANFTAAAGRFPVVWAPAAVVRDSLTESQVLTGNTVSIGGAHIPPGTYTNITASGTSATWLYSGFVASAWA